MIDLYVDALLTLYKGKQPGDYMRNFLECIQNRSEPTSDVASHHRSVTSCHLGNIAIRLGRAIRWEPDAKQIIGDDEANAWLRREQRGHLTRLKCVFRRPDLR